MAKIDWNNMCLEYYYFKGMMMGLGKRGGFDNRFVSDSGKWCRVTILQL